MAHKSALKEVETDLSQTEGEPPAASSLSQLHAERAPAAAANAAAARRRIEALDFARGVAVVLMILSHGINGLLSFDQFTRWGLVPVHLITKFSSSLFVLVFGIAMAVAFLPHTHAGDWPRRRLKLMLTGVVVFFWYKVLTVVEMAHLHEPAEIRNALLYGQFPSYVEILGFYAIALIWVPLLLPLWKRLPLLLRLLAPAAMASLAYYLAQHFHFWGSEPLQALLVEHEDHYTWGQLTRGSLVLAGLLIGELVGREYYRNWGRARLAGLLALASAALFALFLLQVGPELTAQLEAIARNEGKHPPETAFMLFSVGGALAVLALAMAGGERLATALRPITVIGGDALKAFVFHIFVIFVLLRYVLDLWLKLSYEQALFLTLLLILATAAWIRLTNWINERA